VDCCATANWAVTMKQVGMKSKKFLTTETVEGFIFVFSLGQSFVNFEYVV